MTGIIIGILAVLCAGQAVYIHRMNRQLSEWLAYLKSITYAPWQKSFAKGKGHLAEINYEINSLMEENRKHLLKLTRAEETSKQILTNLSHDVRTPLASLIGYLEALEQGRVKKEERDEYIYVAYKKAISLKELVDVLFEWFKINSNEQKYQIAEYDVNELMRQTIIGLFHAAEEKKIALNIHIPEAEWMILADRVAFERIINNLFGNAVKHGGCSEIEIKVQKNEDRVQIEIANNGEVIPREQLPYIFERLYKCDTSRSQNGNGLGLTIVKELVDAMNGNIMVESVQGGKTSFYLEFPCHVRKK